MINAKLIGSVIRWPFENIIVILIIVGGFYLAYHIIRAVKELHDEKLKKQQNNLYSGEVVPNSAESASPLS